MIILDEKWLCCTNLLKADFTKSYQIQGTTWVLGLPNSVNLFNTATRA
jgi:hypothetical protein